MNDVSFKQKLKLYLRLSIKDKILITFIQVTKWMQKYYNFWGKYTLEVNNIQGSEDLILIVAGYKEYLYDYVIPRIYRSIDRNIDVCIVTPGKYDQRVGEYARKYKWSYLYTKENKLSLAQNIAIRLHKNAKFICKLDEDIFVTDRFFEKLKKKYFVALENSCYIPGAITPVININWFTFPFFLATLGLFEDFERTFGKFKHDPGRCDTVNLWSSGEIAVYIWKHSLPIDDIQKKFFDKQDITKDFMINGVRYSIGCFFFTRETFDTLGGFDVTIEGGLGKEEEQFLCYSVIASRPIILCENCFVGHFSFGPQTKEMKDFFHKNSHLFL